MTAGLLAAVRDRLDERATTATDPRVTVGDRVVLVEVSHPDHGRLAGLAHRPPSEADPESVTRAEPVSVPELTGLATAAGERFERAVGIATLNALSVPDVDWAAGDPMAALSAGVDVVATVGLFRPAFRKFEDVEVRVVERNPPESVDAPAGVTVTTHSPEECETAFAGADVCFLTGSMLVYGGIDRYLSALSAAGVSPVVLVGATASQVPGPAFAAGVDVVAGARVTDRDRTRERVAAGDCGTDLHDAGVEKVYIARESGGALAGLGPEPGTGSGETTSRRNTEINQ